ncbi:MAG: hypothetical protein HKN91_17655 [Acidimicrobiia bacterium]|nr:hypothetical protein [Acidimicrobiia bacterium]
MKLRLTLMLGVLAVIAAACGDSGPAVATVNGEPITAEYMAALTGEGGQTINVNTEDFRQALTVEIVWAAVIPAAQREFDIQVSAIDVAERLATPPARYQALFAQLSADGASEQYLKTEAERTIWRDRVIAELIRAEDGYIESTISEAPQEVTAGCVRHILVDSQLEAQAVLDRLNSGENFEALAAELSTDDISGSDVIGGCPVGFGGFVQPFAFAASTAPLNEPFGPVQSEFGFHVILVEQRIGPPTVEQLRDDPVNFYPGVTLSGFFTPWFNDAVRTAEIDVADSVGRWSPDGVGIVPPEQ